MQGWELLVCCWCCCGITLAGAMSAAPVFVMDYALAPSSRWRGALALATQGRSWEDSWGPIFKFHDAQLFSKLEKSDVARLGAALDAHFHTQAQELRGVAAQFGELFPEQAAKVTYEYLALISESAPRPPHRGLAASWARRTR